MAENKYTKRRKFYGPEHLDSIVSRAAVCSSSNKDDSSSHDVGGGKSYRDRVESIIEDTAYSDDGRDSGIGGMSRTAGSNDVMTAETSDNHDTFSRYQGHFVRSTISFNTFNLHGESSSTQGNETLITGDEAKLFYDSVISTSPLPSMTPHMRKESKKKKKRGKRRNMGREHETTESSSTSKTKSINLDTIKKDIATLFRLCEGKEGKSNIQELRAHLVRVSSSCTVSPNAGCFSSVDNSCPSSTRNKRNNPNRTEYIKIINSSDQYGWTALMCAAACNNLEAVKLLIQEGAHYNRTLVDKGGYTLRDICVRNNATDVEVYLSSLEEDDYKTNSVNTDDCVGFDDNDEVTECETCGVSLRKSLLKKHETSVAHLLKDTSKSLPDNPYTIPEHNVGFQMMLRTGWEQQSGLGPDGSGRKKPVKTTLKLDKAGLGLNKTKERVSHFKARDEKAVGVRTHKDIVATEQKKRKERSTTVALKKQQKQRSQFWERDLRRYMTMDD